MFPIHHYFLQNLKLQLMPGLRTLPSADYHFLRLSTLHYCPKMQSDTFKSEPWLDSVIHRPLKKTTFGSYQTTAQVTRIRLNLMGVTGVVLIVLNLKHWSFDLFELTTTTMLFLCSLFLSLCFSVSFCLRILLVHEFFIKHLTNTYYFRFICHIWKLWIGDMTKLRLFCGWKKSG